MPKRQIKDIITITPTADEITSRTDNLKTEFAAKLAYQFMISLRFRKTNGVPADNINIPFTDGDGIIIPNPNRDPNQRRRKSKRDRPLVFNEFMDRSNDLLLAIIEFDEYLNNVRLHGDIDIRQRGEINGGPGSEEDQSTSTETDIPRTV